MAVVLCLKFVFEVALRLPINNQSPKVQIMSSFLPIDHKQPVPLVRVLPWICSEIMLMSVFPHLGQPPFGFCTAIGAPQATHVAAWSLTSFPHSGHVINAITKPSLPCVFALVPPSPSSAGVALLLTRCVVSCQEVASRTSGRHLQLIDKINTFDSRNLRI